MNFNIYKFKVQDILDPKRNNTDLIRLFLAIAVIWGHASTIRPVVGYSDFFTTVFRTDISGVAVWVFFFLSGLLVTNSLMTKRNVLDFLVARFFRVYPALVVNVVITALLIGPAFSSYSYRDYFDQFGWSTYILNNIELNAQYWLPGVFDNNYNKSVVNGSLWTIKYEVFAYLTLAFFYCFGFVNRALVVVFMALCLLQFLLQVQILPYANGSPDYLVISFLFGVFFYLFRQRIELSLKQIALFFILFAITKGLAISWLFLQMFLFCAILYISATPILLRVKPSIDISYGVYLWGYVVAQILVTYYPTQSIEFNQFATVFVSIVIATLSSVFVERPAIKLGKNFIVNINKYMKVYYRE